MFARTAILATLGSQTVHSARLFSVKIEDPDGNVYKTGTVTKFEYLKRALIPSEIQERAQKSYREMRSSAPLTFVGSRDPKENKMIAINDITTKAIENIVKNGDYERYRTQIESIEQIKLNEIVKLEKEALRNEQWSKFRAIPTHDSSKREDVREKKCRGKPSCEGSEDSDNIVLPFFQFRFEAEFEHPFHCRGFNPLDAKLEVCDDVDSCVVWARRSGEDPPIGVFKIQIMPNPFKEVGEISRADDWIRFGLQQILCQIDPTQRMTIWKPQEFSERECAIGKECSQKSRSPLKIFEDVDLDDLEILDDGK